MALAPPTDETAFCPDSRAAWRAWLEQHHAAAQNVWLLIYNKGSGVPSLSVADAVEEALCFGWIDSKANKRDGQSRYQLFSRRKPKSAWSAINKERVERLTREGWMRPAGQALIDLAMQTGTWTALDTIDEVPEDLAAALSGNAAAQAFWDGFPPSARRAILDWIRQARRPETRAARIAETVRSAAENKRANQFTPKGKG